MGSPIVPTVKHSRSCRHGLRATRRAARKRDVGPKRAERRGVLTQGAANRHHCTSRRPYDYVTAARPLEPPSSTCHACPSRTAYPSMKSRVSTATLILSFPPSRSPLPSLPSSNLSPRQQHSKPCKSHDRISNAAPRPDTHISEMAASRILIAASRALTPPACASLVPNTPRRFAGKGAEGGAHSRRDQDFAPAAREEGDGDLEGMGVSMDTALLLSGSDEAARDRFPVPCPHAVPCHALPPVSISHPPSPPSSPHSLLPPLSPSLPNPSPSPLSIPPSTISLIPPLPPPFP